MRLSLSSRLELIALQLATFLIPANLAFHFDTSSAFVNGRLVDYLLPKLYASDLPIMFLVGLFLFRSIKSFDIKALSRHVSRIFPILLVIFLLVSSLVSSHFQAGFWYSFKVIELLFFGYYLTTRYSYSTFLKLIFPPLITSVLLQTIIVLYQYIYHIPLFGYFFLGQSSLAGIDVAKTSTLHGLEVIPYGTTPHPNVLAGFYAIASLVIYLRSTLSPTKSFKCITYALFIGLFPMIFYLTRSWSALSGLVVAFLIYKLRFIIGSSRFGLLLLACVISTQAFSLIFIDYLHHWPKLADNPSISNRYELIHLADKIIQVHPLSGVGPNQFTANLPAYPLPGQQTYFLQPVHHAGFLILAELGFVGFALILASLITWLANSTRSKPSVSAFLPFLALSTILCLDHYPLTLQTGQLLLTLSMVIPLLKSSLPGESPFQ